MPAEASQEERILLYQLDREVVNLPNMADALDELGKLAKTSVSVSRILLDNPPRLL
jgi:hypothetical protein